VGADVREIAGDGGERKHRPVLEVERENGRAGFCVEGMKGAGVGSCEVDFAVADGRRSDDPGALVWRRPRVFSGGGVERVEL